MADKKHYCDFCNEMPADSDNPNKYYHDYEYGFEIENDNELFERLVLEINQAGLSWNTILQKRKNFQEAYARFDINTVAGFGEKDIDALLQNSGIIRNKLKVNAAIYNANKIIELQQEFGSFKQWLDLHKEYDLIAWVKLFKKHFKFVGGEIVNEFLMSTAYLPGSHRHDCPIHKKTIFYEK
ncbi:DNA-3-methyladenine glycosylase I [Myroides marinus]|uniref:DNA-3-methyladenine glycosylase n=1 Tax=Myroides marinus TaxID=703342 RepID=A0A165RQS4_9FLAO|nr:DNA-3-methyladenine glycosylase I [Myroides marinus]KZE84864.1 DNA-3-methyladenine glycosylase [Myroides marinus]MDM1354960.1 DNA-3-methyladenine glycosylase I [Myroides marinus]MDM1361758.1 DNA-3-methyladenine glycosylase I [Myroides marinus]MDM1364321.1 DNA-3-methyladenine glycosylase I [Myroides marinus]MDM1373052.1 DNA-3-methyladenine glycosylase I [Myroides marinus]